MEVKVTYLTMLYLYFSNSAGDPTKLRKFIVFDSCLHILLADCIVCQSSCVTVLKRIVGTLAVYEQHCINGHVQTWETQPRTGAMRQGNLGVYM